MHEAPAAITHLIGPDTPPPRAETLRALCAERGPRQRIVQWGPAPAWAARSRCGADPRRPDAPARTIHAPWGAAWLGRRACDFLLDEVGTGIVHVWSPAALRWIAAGLPRARCRPIVDIDLPAEYPRLATAIGSPWHDGTLRFVCPTDAARRRIIATGVQPADCVLIREGTDFARARAAGSRNVRGRLRLGARDLVVLALPPPARETGAFTAAWGALLLAHVLPQTRLVVPGEGREVERIRRLVGACRQRHLLRCPAGRLDLYELLAAADLALYLPPGDAPLSSVVAAMGAGTPIVAAATPLTTELLRHGHNAWLTRTATPREVCRRLLDAFEDRAQTRQQAELARMQAYKVFGKRRMIEQYARLWSNVLAGRPAGRDIDDPARLPP